MFRLRTLLATLSVATSPAAQAESAAVAANAAPAAACAGAEHRQFDFWLGEWTLNHSPA